jgi:hypothetical protein
MFEALDMRHLVASADGLRPGYRPAAVSEVFSGFTTRHGGATGGRVRYCGEMAGIGDQEPEWPTPIR